VLRGSVCGNLADLPRVEEQIIAPTERIKNVLSSTSFVSPADFPLYFGDFPHPPMIHQACRSAFWSYPTIRRGEKASMDHDARPLTTNSASTLPVSAA